MKVEKKEELGQRILDLINGKKSVRKSTGQNEATAADGGYTVFHDIIPDILSANFAEGTLYNDCKHYTVGPKANGLKIPVSLETTRSSTTVKGGVRAYVVSEGVAKTPSKGAFAQLDLPLKKAAAVVYITDELKQDAVSLSSYIYDAQKEAIMALIDYQIIQGDGSLLNGIVSEPSTGFTTCADPITDANLKSIFKLYYGGKNGKWYVSKVRWNQIIDAYNVQVADADAPAGMGPMLEFDNGTYYLFGLPVVVSDVMLDNQILLADLTQYVIAEKGIRTDVNESLKFVEDESVLRSVFRINGAGLWRNPITLADGSVVHPFVMSDDTVNSSSSSSSSVSSNSSSSSSSYDEHNTSSSSSDLYSNSSDSSSSKSVSSESSSSHSQSSASSESSSSHSNSSASSDSSSSLSSESSESSSSHSESSSQSSGWVGPCNESYTASGFTLDPTLNGVYEVVGRLAGKAYYANATNTRFIFWNATFNVFAIAATAGAAPANWLSNNAATTDCPNGTYEGVAGTVA